tara:strand:- start:13070 stop:13186 length:117 start_codon:yes stop_codon:yes gene_type:complete
MMLSDYQDGSENDYWLQMEWLEREAEFMKANGWTDAGS